MKMRHSTASLVIAATLFAGCASTGLAQSASPGGGTSVTIPTSSIANPLDAGKRGHTNIRFLLSPGKFNGAPQLTGPPFPGYFYEDPASLACIYNLVRPQRGCNPNVVTTNPSGGGKAIAIVDAYDDPNAYTDLQAFSSQFGVAAINPTTFQVVYAPPGGTTPGSCSGAATEPPVDPTGGWEIEESLDIEMAHSMAPAASLYLVEAQSNYYTDLLCAETIASKLVAAAGGGEVSNSWTSGEFLGETTFDPVFTTPKVVYFVSAGDSPGPQYPSASPNVVSVGGTSLSTDPITGNFIFENTWQEAGGGQSAYESRPSYQNRIAYIVGTQRGTPDVAADANPYTGVWVLDNFVAPDYGTTSCGSTPCWIIVGGTSVSSPMWAGIVNAAGSFSASTNAELTKLYRDQNRDFTDITYGTCGPYMGYFAFRGWDFCSGLGSPESYKGK
jgi:kumamolisin